MKLTQLTVQLWLDDLAQRTHAEYTIKYSENTAIHNVRNEHGTVQFVKDNKTKKWFHRETFYDGSLYDGSTLIEPLKEADEFIRILNEIDK